MGHRYREIRITLNRLEAISYPLLLASSVRFLLSHEVVYRTPCGAQNRRNCLNKKQRIKVSVNFSLEHCKSSQKQGTPKFSCTRKQIINIDVIKPPRNVDSYIIHSSKIMGRPSPRLRQRNQFEKCS